MTRFDDIQARHAKATPGPWEAIHDLADEEMSWVMSVADGELYVTPRPMGRYDEGLGRADAEFIAHCPDDVRWLLDRVTQLETVLRQIAERKRGTVTTSASEPVFVDGEERPAVYVRGQSPEEIARAALDTEGDAT